MDQEVKNTEKKQLPRPLVPSVDIFENETELLLVADVPGARVADIDVHVELPEVRIEAKVLANAERPLVYTRTFHVDERVDPQGVKAEYKDGVLRVHMAKSAAFRPHRVSVQAS